MKIQKEYKELLAINKILIFSDIYKDQQEMIMDYINKLCKEIKILNEENERLKKKLESK